ncbi:MAG: hypothetical protein FFODKBPE_00658 [Candidatus Argoarchaeum ethanivorans]|uniref:Uncharacterized protein n=1 Tax=Candidatus Argoarchaeum ethanivorans TaxID=2608793 RepID=A0A811TEY3_9EURY|nr:MAG: hypothetical protein FFODKBPE_00658 [Candidatus Argoarchaeum ethanivorans]
MTTKRKMRAIALFGMLAIVMSFGIQTASAGPLGGGDSFENATRIYSGHSSEAWLEVGDEDYFYIMVDAGQTLVLEGSIVTDNRGSMRHSIHDEDKSPLNDGGVDGAFVSNTIRWSPDSGKDSYKFYTKVECVHEYSYGGTGQYNINVSIEDHYDASSGTDAGNTFDTAMNITPGSYDGFLAGKYYGDQGTDNKDLYKLPLEAGETINVKLTPADNVKLKTMIYNEDRAKMHSTESPETGVITRSSWTAPYAQDVYVLIERTGSYPSGTYHLDLSVESPGEHGLSIASFETSSTTATGTILKTNVSITKTASFDAWYTVVASGVNSGGYPIAGTACVKLACDSVTVPVWISIPPGAEIGDYNLYADVYALDWNLVASTGPQVVTLAS